LKYWEIIADNLSKAGWSWGCVAAIDATGMSAAPLKRLRVWRDMRLGDRFPRLCERGPFSR
jgi:hypothetical protein